MEDFVDGIEVLFARILVQREIIFSRIDNHSPDSSGTCAPCGQHTLAKWCPKLLILCPNSLYIRRPLGV